MKKFTIALSLLSVAALPATQLLATTATSLSSFGGIEEPSAIVRTSGVTQGDTYKNITDQGSGRFRMLLRYHKGQWCDGDRSSTNENMQRAEVKVLGTRQTRGQTFTYSSQWRTSSGYRFSTTNTCAIQQVKATDGDNNQALSGTLLQNGTGRTAHGAGSGMTTVRTFSWSVASWLTVSNRIKVSSSAGKTDGAFETSINGDSFSGIHNVKMERPSSTTYQPKWGLYRSIGNLNIDRGTDEYVEHQNCTATRN